MGAIRGLSKKELIKMGQEFMDKNPGVRFTGSKLHEATGISASIISYINAVVLGGYISSSIVPYKSIANSSHFKR